MRPYVYRKLDGSRKASVNDGRGNSQQVPIRLLELLPGDAGDDLRCRLLHTSLSHRIAYETLSYTWGSPDRIHSICCDGSSIRVTDTLREALTTLRRSNKKRSLWIDQLCIDQENISERADQVRVMHLIYQHATRTIVFLSSGCAPAMNLRLGRRRLYRDLKKAQMEGESDLLKECVALFAHPWFQRVWILQEIGMSNVLKIVCYYRGYKLRWGVIRQAETLMGSYEPGQKYESIQMPPSIERHRMLMSKWTAIGTGSAQFPTLDRYGFLYHGGNKLWYILFLLSMEPRLVETLQDSRFCLATDPRDKVYSLLNLLKIDSTKDKFAPLLEVDYSLPVAEVYAKAARYSIETERSLEILCYKEASSMPDLPSWAPNWIEQRLFPVNRIALPYHFRSQFHKNAWPVSGSLVPFRRTRNVEPVASFSADGRLLTLSGQKLDDVENLSSIWTTALEIEDKTLFYDWASIYTGGKPSEMTDLPFIPETKPKGVRVPPFTVFDFWLRVGRHSRLKTTDSIIPFYSDHPAKQEWRKSSYHRHRRGRGLMMHRVGNLHFLFFHDWLATTLPYASIGRRVAATKNGFFALVPAVTEMGDQVYFFDGGGSLGYVLRKKKEMESFEFIGTAYVHGFYGVKITGEQYRETVTIQ